MNVRTVCLSILYEGEATGYEIRRLCVEGECSYFVEASFGSIYPALAKLEDEKLVVSRVEPQEGKPAKKVYSITDKGRDAFVASLFEPMGDDVFRSPFLLFVRFAHLLPAGLVESRLQEKLGQMDSAITRLEDIFKDRSSHAADAWVLNYGLVCARVARDHLATHMHELVGLARAENPLRSAAE